MFNNYICFNMKSELVYLLQPCVVGSTNIPLLNKKDKREKSEKSNRIGLKRKVFMHSYTLPRLRNKQILDEIKNQRTRSAQEV